MNITLVGYGYWGPNLVRNLLMLGDPHSITVVDVSDAALVRCRIEHPGLGAVTTTIPWDRTDVLVIATPPTTHRGLIDEALSRQIHCFCEKPCGTAPSDLDDITVPETVVFQAGYVYCYHPYIAWLKEHLPSFGTIHRIRATRTDHAPKIRLDLSVLEDMACHDIALALHLFGPPDDVDGWAAGQVLDPSIDDTVVVGLHWTPPRRWMIITASWTEPEKERRWILTGDAQSLVWDDCVVNHRMELHDVGHQRIVSPDGQQIGYLPYRRLLERVDVPWDEPLRRELRAFLQACTGAREQNLTNFEFTKEVWDILYQVRTCYDLGPYADWG